MVSAEIFQSNGKVLRFNRASFSGREKITYMGEGSLGAKARGLARISPVLENKIGPLFRPIIDVDIPLLTVVATDYFDDFVGRDNLLDSARSAMADEQIALAFAQVDLPAELAADLRAFLAQVRVPLAVRSSSLLEDAMGEPFAGVYATVMVANDQPDLEDRLWRLSQAIKYVYASTFFRQAKDYRSAASRENREEKMGVIIQEVVGTSHDGRFYPHISGVAKSFNFYPLGFARPEDGAVDLALGLGKMIVEHGVSWPYSPSHPHVNPPYTTVRDLLKRSQKEFWAISLGECRAGGQSAPAEYVRKFPLADAEQDGTLFLLASTYDAEDDRIIMGVHRPGPRIVDFAHIVKGEMIPLTSLLQCLLKECAEIFGTMVTIEFALTWAKDAPPPARFGFLQVRPMVVSNAQVDLRPEQLEGDNVLVASESVLGNGRRDDINDIVYVIAETFDVAHTRMIASDLEEINRKLSAQNRSYILIGYGRWGSSDPSAGIPINFAQICAAGIIVETTLPGIDFMLSQGSHFFHNVTSFNILYFSVTHAEKYAIDWEWLEAQSVVTETNYVRHVRAAQPLQVAVDGRTGRGAIYKSIEK